MLRFARTTALAALLLAAASLNAAPAGPSGVGAVDLAWKKAVIANDLEAILACYAPDAVAWLPEMPEARGATALREAYKAFQAANTIRDFTMSESHSEGHGDHSVGWGRFLLTIVPKAGDGKPVPLAGRFTEVAVRRDGRWVYLVDHASAEPAPVVSGTPK